jgi:hypothetical protein
MAVGDIINSVTTQVASYFYFQPAAGVEIVILALPTASANHFFLYDGVNMAAWTNTSSSTTSGLDPTNMKIGITNTNYLGLYNTGAYSSYTGIQIK